MPAAPLPELFNLSGRHALVTGSARGLGWAIAEGLAQAGATVWLNGRDAAALAVAADRLRVAQPGAGVHTLAFDITDAAALAQALDRIVAAGGLHILVNNVGQRDRRPLDAFSLDDVRRLLDVNVVAAFELARQAARRMAQPGAGRIVNITSIAGPISRAGDAVYTTAKGALDAMTRALAAELGPRGITVNAVAPGYFATEANADMVADGGVADWLARRTSLGRWGDPREIAGAVVFLASEAASYVTGQTLAVDGGYLAHF
ncbi:MAG: SDR family oxidoreductase [Pseudomonadota bacterium]